MNIWRWNKFPFFVINCSVILWAHSKCVCVFALPNRFQRILMCILIKSSPCLVVLRLMIIVINIGLLKNAREPHLYEHLLHIRTFIVHSYQKMLLNWYNYDCACMCVSSSPLLEGFFISHQKQFIENKILKNIKSPYDSA